MLKNPASGGMPAIENMKIARASAIIGLVRDSPARSSMPSTICSRRRMHKMQAKTPRFMTT